MVSGPVRPARGAVQQLQNKEGCCKDARQECRRLHRRSCRSAPPARGNGMAAGYRAASPQAAAPSLSVACQSSLKFRSHPLPIARLWRVLLLTPRGRCGKHGFPPVTITRSAVRVLCQQSRVVGSASRREARGPARTGAVAAAARGSATCTDARHRNHCIGHCCTSWGGLCCTPHRMHVTGGSIDVVSIHQKVRRRRRRRRHCMLCPLRWEEFARLTGHLQAIPPIFPRSSPPKTHHHGDATTFSPPSRARV